MKFLYNISQYGFYFALLIASLFNKKAQLAIRGRKDWKSTLRNLVDTNASYIWIHCSSLGEFEQGRPVIEQLKTDYPAYKIVLTFFSPSGYEIRKNYEMADIIMYLPIDISKNANHFIDQVKPKLAFFVKYDLWINYINACHAVGIPIILFSAKFRATQHYFNKWYGQFFLKALRKLTFIFVQDNFSLELLKKNGLNNGLLASDTRIDRVVEMASRAKPLDWVEKFKGTHKLIVLGSTWLKDESILMEVIKSKKKYKCIVVPHTVDNFRIKEIINKVDNMYILYSTMNNNDVINADAQFLIVDKIGLLNTIYPYADLVYIGGGFTSGIHNTQEPAIYGKPILIGPKYYKFKEAEDLIALQGIKVIENKIEFEFHLNNLIENEILYKEMGNINRSYLLLHKGGTSSIIEHLKNIL